MGYITHKRRKYHKENSTKKNSTKRRRKTNNINYFQKGGDDSTIKVMTYNVLARGATFHQSEKHGFKINKDNYHTNTSATTNQAFREYEHIEQTFKRYEMFKNEIVTNKPDIVLLQEVDNYFYQYIKQNLIEYDVFFNLFIPRLILDLSANFATAVMWKKTVFEKTLGETLDSELAKTATGPEPSFGNKNASFVILKHNNTKKQFVVVSIHLPGNENNDINTTEKENLLNFVLEKVKKVEATNTSDKYFNIIGGDFNCPMETNCSACCSEVIRNILNTEEYEEAKAATTSKPIISTCSFDYLPKGSSEKEKLIDAIFYKSKADEHVKFDKAYTQPNFECDDNTSHPYDNITTQQYADINTASDHAWLMADFLIN